LGYLGRRYSKAAVVLTAGLMWLAYRRDPGRRFRREHDMLSLLGVAGRHFPCLRPIVRTGPITAMDNFSGPWAIARTPLQFALENALLLDPEGRPYGPGEVMGQETGLPLAGSPALGAPNSLDVGKLRALLVAQLGPPFGGDPGRLTGRRRALAAAFLAHAMDRKDEAMAVFDSLSTSWDPKTLEVDGAVAGRVLSRLPREGRPAALMAHAAFETVWFMALLELARAKGALPSSLWIWLRPTDRPLFYALNQVGGVVAWAEAAGPFAHLEAEKRAGMGLHDPRVEPAAAALAKSLQEDGYLPPPTPPPVVAATPGTADTPDTADAPEPPSGEGAGGGTGPAPGPLGLGDFEPPEPGEGDLMWPPDEGAEEEAYRRLAPKPGQ
jgi:hypothetical protein